MVFYFKVITKSELDDDFGFGDSGLEYVIYMGRDKVENDPLIKHSNKKNLWFHVDNYSSAHLYLELPEDKLNVKFEDLKLEEDLLELVAQLTKANSIKANKLNNITIIYTPVDNLHTDGSMDIGTVTFNNPKKVKRILVAKKENAIVNKINKTKTEISTEEFIKKEQEREQKRNWELKERERKKKKEQLLFQQQKENSKDPYSDLFDDKAIHASSNEFRNENWVEEEFW